MHRFILLITLIFSLSLGVYYCGEHARRLSLQEPISIKNESLASPDGRAQFWLVNQSRDHNQGRLLYHISYDGVPVIEPSRMGLRFAAQHGFDDDLQIIALAKHNHDETWEQPWGEQRFIRDHYNEWLVTVQRITNGQVMNVRVRAFNDGVAFRYEVPEQAGFDDVLITEEITEFDLDAKARSWWTPARKWNRYEYLYETTPLAEIDEVHTPLTIRLPTNNIHVAIHEAALVDYSGMSLSSMREGRLQATLAPRAEGGLVKLKGGFKTPWRTIQIADTAAGLVDSDMILNLNEPNKLGDMSWFKPGKYIGIWWDMHIRERSWGTDYFHGATTQYTKYYMDFAAEHGFDGVLVEGWNIGWDGDWYHNGDVFSFTESYPDFDIAAIAAYGRKRGVKLIGHHETSGNITNYENQIKDAFKLYQQHDVAIVKTGYVADAGDIKRIGDNGVTYYEYHDGQEQNDHHLRVVKLAAKHQIAINPHEPVKDTGLRRTYPNWVSREGARGMEYSAWGVPPNTPEHMTIMPYTRLLSAPMDYTPGIFDLRPNEQPPVMDNFPRHDKRARIETTLAKQLALYVVIYSPIQMAADLPRNYEKRMDAFQFIKDVPADWEESYTLAGEVGDYIVSVRKDRNSQDWYLGALTDENKRRLDIDFSFLEDGVYEAQIYRDGAQADYENAPYDIVIETRQVSKTDKMSLRLGRSGGAAIRFKKIK